MSYTTSKRGAALVLLACACVAPSCSSTVGDINRRAMILQSRAAPGQNGPSLDWAPPEPTEYRIGPRDLLEIAVYELEEPNKSKVIKTRVSQFGTIVLPLVGLLHAGGDTTAELRAAIVEKLGADYIINPTVNVIVAEYRSRRITVLGSVESPGAFNLRENSTTLVDALALAGGPTEKAGSTVYVVRAPEPSQAATAAAVPATAKVVESRPRPRLLKIDLTDLMERGNPGANCVLDDGDVVHVPAASSIFVTGKVKKGGSFPLRGRITLLRAIALAGGLENEASPGLTVLVRTTENGPRTIPVDLNRVKAGTEDDLLMQADDVLVITESKTSKALRDIGGFFTGLFRFGYNL